MANQKDLADQLTALTTEVGKIGDETTATLQKVTDLEAALAAAGDISPEVQTALDALKAQAQKVDDMVPDASATPENPAPEQPQA